MLTASCQHNNTSCSRLSLTMYDDLTIEEWIETTASKHETLSSPRIAAESSTPCANAKRCAPDEPCLRPYPTPEPQPKRRRKTCSMDDGLRLYDIDATPRAATIRPLVQHDLLTSLGHIPWLEEITIRRCQPVKARDTPRATSVNPHPHLQGIRCAPGRPSWVQRARRQNPRLCRRSEYSFRRIQGSFAAHETSYSPPCPTDRTRVCAGELIASLRAKISP
jgi:hypothetical protein